jgi:hypothetical protein
VSFSHKKSNGQRDFTAVGHTVSASTSAIAAAWSLFGSPVIGQLKEELYTSALQDCLLVVVNKEDYERARALMHSPLKQIGIVHDQTPVFQSYQLNAEDCIDWMISVANELQPRGFKVPPRTITDPPLTYMQRLTDANS